MHFSRIARIRATRFKLWPAWLGRAACGCLIEPGSIAGSARSSRDRTSWDFFKPYRDVRIVGSASVEGVPTTRTTEIAFAGGEQDLPIWFELWVDAQGIVHRAQMRAPGHYILG